MLLIKKDAKPSRNPLSFFKTRNSTPSRDTAINNIAVKSNGLSLELSTVFVIPELTYENVKTGLLSKFKKNKHLGKSKVFAEHGETRRVVVPADIIKLILSHGDLKALISCRAVCKDLKLITREVKNIARRSHAKVRRPEVIKRIRSIFPFLIAPMYILINLPSDDAIKKMMKIKSSPELGIFIKVDLPRYGYEDKDSLTLMRYMDIHLKTFTDSRVRVINIQSSFSANINIDVIAYLCVRMLREPGVIEAANEKGLKIYISDEKKQRQICFHLHNGVMGIPYDQSYKFLGFIEALPTDCLKMIHTLNIFFCSYMEILPCQYVLANKKRICGNIALVGEHLCKVCQCRKNGKPKIEDVLITVSPPTPSQEMSHIKLSVVNKIYMM